MLELLILDDDRQVLDTLVRSLGLPGVRITACEEIELALILVAQRHYDMVVTDLQVSELGGFEGMRLVRFLRERRRATRVYILSGYVDSAARALGLGLGVLEVLEKPSGLARLRDLVRMAQDAECVGPDGGDDGGANGGCTVPEAFTLLHAGRLNEYLATDGMHAVLAPIVSLDPSPGAGPPYSMVAVEGCARGPTSSVLSDPRVLYAYAAAKDQSLRTDLGVAGEALSAAASLPGAFDIFLHVQPLSLVQPDFETGIARVLSAAGIPAERIVFEIGNGRASFDPDALAAAVESLRQRGYCFALDDFGSGHSNLQLAHSIRPEFLKLAPTFSAEPGADQAAEAVVASTVDLANRLGIRTIITAVATPEASSAAQGMGVNLGQGPLFGKPGPPQELRTSSQFDQFGQGINGRGRNGRHTGGGHGSHGGQAASA